MYNNSALGQQTAIAELPALEDFVSRLQKSVEELNNLNNRLYTIANKLSTDPPQENKISAPMQPRRFNEGLLSSIESLLTNVQDQINYKEDVTRKLESLV